MERVLIVGGVAGGASAAARLRRLREDVEIVVFDRGPHVSFANCGLPYFVGNVIAEEKNLLLASAGVFRDRFNIQVRTEHEVLSIDRVAQTLRVKNLQTGEERDEPWDQLVLAPGAAPIRPGFLAQRFDGVFVVRTIADSQKIRDYLESQPRQRAIVVGGGFIGLEMAENLAHRGMAVTIVERQTQIMPQLDAEVAALLALHLEEKGVGLRLGAALERLEPRRDGHGLELVLAGGEALEADLVILALGVRPETHLAEKAGLAMGAKGGILVDSALRTSDPRIVAVGDAVEVRDVIGGQEVVLPLAGPANRQGRIAAETVAGRSASFRGVQGTAIVQVFGLAAAITGATEKGLVRRGEKNFHAIYLHPGHHAGYYPGSKPLHIKLIFGDDRRILGAQAVGAEGVDKRIDVIATMIQMGGTVDDLAEVELCYAPQFGSAKDPVNVAGMMAQNVLNGDMPLADWSRVHAGGHRLIDVREPHEFAGESIAGAENWPLNSLRSRVAELPKDEPLWLYCAAGQRGYFAQRLLKQLGYAAFNLSGGMATYKAFRAAEAAAG